MLKIDMTQDQKNHWNKTIKQGLMLWFGAAYWLTFGLFILFGWIAEGAGLGITLFILFLVGYISIAKMSKFMIRRSRKNA